MLYRVHLVMTGIRTILTMCFIHQYNWSPDIISRRPFCSSLWYWKLRQWRVDLVQTTRNMKRNEFPSPSIRGHSAFISFRPSRICCLLSNLSSPISNHLNLIHIVLGHKRKTKYDWGLYHVFRFCSYAPVYFNWKWVLRCPMDTIFLLSFFYLKRKFSVTKKTHLFWNIVLLQNPLSERVTQWLQFNVIWTFFQLCHQSSRLTFYLTSPPGL
jgi:hypothetical protein